MRITKAEAKEKIIVALDVATAKEAMELVELLHDEVGAFKIGLQLYNAEGPDIIHDIQEAGGKVFVDLKFHDIPNTVAQTTKVITGRGAFMFTVHAGGGARMLEATANAKNQTATEKGVDNPIALAVTVLTSLSQEEFENEIGIARKVEDQVIHWAKMAKNAGMDGVVASPKEIKAIRQACGDDLIIVTPGIRPLWAAANDQSRIMTPKQAVEAGADYLVIGRPITKHENPVAAARLIVDEITEM